MTSLGSLSFVEALGISNIPSNQLFSSVPCRILHSNSTSCTLFQKGACFQRVGGLRLGLQKVLGSNYLVGFSSNDELVGYACSEGRYWVNKAQRGFFVLKAAGENPGEEGDDAEDALQVTIEKGKKVLAVQRDLLQKVLIEFLVLVALFSPFFGVDVLSKIWSQERLLGRDISVPIELYQDCIPWYIRPLIVDVVNYYCAMLIPVHFGASNKIEGRRKLVSSIKKNIDSKEQEIIGSSKSNNSFSDIDRSSTGGEPDWKYESSIFSKNFASSTVVGISETPSVGTNEKFDDEEQELMRDFLEKRLPFDADADEQLEETTQLKVMPLFLQKTLKTSYLVDEKLEELTESKVEGTSDEIDVGSGEEVSEPPPLAGSNVMNIILVAAECAPWSKTGGLGDVAGALPKALARRGHRVMVVAPRYSDYREAQETGVRKKYHVAGQDMDVTYFQAYIDGVDFVFIENHMFRSCSNSIYGGDRLEILKRMVLFCKAAVEVPWYVPCGGVCYGDGNLVFIANDWHTALLPVYLKAYYRDNGLMKYTRSVLVIHNIAHQGRGPVDDFAYVDLPDHYIDLFKLYDPIGGEHFNIFSAGLKTTDRIVTVSHGYARELKTIEGGWGLHEIINSSDWKLRGIVNGIDATEWNPELDVHLKSDGYTNYSLANLKTGKLQCKAALQKELGLPIRSDVPLIGFIGRLDSQKGVDLISEAIPWMVGQDVQLIMLGTGRDDLENMLRQFEEQHRDKVRGWVGFSVQMAHRITAGADILLMPSRFEPCGLNQLYAMRYGTVPVVHAVGGLRDTVQPFDPFKESGLGWTFERAESGRLIHVLGNCLWTFRDYKDSWEGIQRRGMMQDLSWDNAAQQYEEVLVAAKYQW